MMSVRMQLEKETKGAVRYMEVDAGGNQLKGDDAVLASIYIRKAALDGSPPKFFNITMEAE